MENIKICQRCGGSCCKWIPGAFHPNDFNGANLEDILFRGFVTKQYVVDYSSEGKIYVMPNTVKGSKWGVCIFLTKDGCELSYEKRPRECRMLEPKEGTENCKAHSSKEECAEAWEHYRDIVRNIYDKVCY